MKTYSQRSILSGTLMFSVALLVGSFVGCKQKAPETQTQIQDAPYVPNDGSVSFNLLPTQGGAGSQSWLASYADESGVTKFSIELGPATTASSNPSLSSGKGAFTPVTGSDPIPLLEHLKKAIQAKHMPVKIQQVDKVEFNYVVLGTNQSRSASGAFSSNPAGNWMALKVFLGPNSKDEGEVFLNINPVTHTGEFAMKDPDYGDFVLAQIAKIL